MIETRDVSIRDEEGHATRQCLYEGVGAIVATRETTAGQPLAGRSQAGSQLK